jgi:peroxiredoxin
VSFDSPADNKKFADSKTFAFELWTDESRALAMHFGAADAVDSARAKRITVLLDAEGRELVDYRGFINMGAHPGYVLDDLDLVLPK